MNQTLTQATPKKRIEYIDALRGFTMILVVFYHVALFTFKSESSFVNQLFLSFRMPLFFFISGFIGYKANVVWNKETWWAMSKKKLLIQLIPTFVFGLIYAYVYRHIDFSVFVMDLTKYGYWFTLVLLEIFLVVYTLNVLLYHPNPKIFKRRQIISLVFLSILFFCAKYALNIIPFISKLSNLFSLYCLFKYFPFFAFGYICSMNKDRFHNVLANKNISFGLLLLFAFCFYANSYYVYPNIDDSLLLRVSYHSIETIVGFWGLLIVYNTFRHYSDSFTSDKKVGKVLQYIGKRTLDIYLLHWFFLPVWSQLGDFFSNGKNIALELTLGGGISLLVIGICLVVSNILRTSPILAKYLFGAK